jgi:methionyl-tRNA formyltransferase
MLLDEEMDHGPIIAQKEYKNDDWPPKASELEAALAHFGGQMLAETLPKYVAREIIPVSQNHSQATYTKKIKKEDGLLDLGGDAEENFRKIQAFNVWPRAYFFHKPNGKKMRVIVTDAALENGELIIKKVLPEGQDEINCEEFLKRLK